MFRACGIGLATVSVTCVAWGLPNGITSSSCSGCHTADVEYDGRVSLVANGELAPGVATPFTLRIEESHMKSAGFFVDSASTGTFTAGSGVRASEAGVVHSRPIPAVDGVVEVTFSWTPPEQADGLDMWVYVIAADDSSSQLGDIATSAAFPLVWGCDGIPLYEDIDADGYGNRQGALSVGCGPRDGWSMLDSDCDDVRTYVHPGATEAANGKDDDCNGLVDDGIVIETWYLDADGDGYGVVGTGIDTDIGPEGYVGNSDDCNDSNNLIAPDAVEVCDGVDNDCDRLIDEGVYVECGVGLCRRRWEMCDTECVPDLPRPEVCNALDDDCDGEIDEQTTCADGSACENGECPNVTLGEPVASAALSSDAVTESAPPEEAALVDASVIPTTAVNAPDASPTDSASASTETSDVEQSQTLTEEATPQGSSKAGGCSLGYGSNTPWVWLAWTSAALVMLRRRARC